MSELYQFNQSEKATVCAEKNCITVYGDTARIVNKIAVTASIFIAIALIAEATR